MPAPNQIDPNLSRERGMFETKEKYAERMKKLDERDALFASIFTPPSDPLSPRKTTFTHSRKSAT